MHVQGGQRQQTQHIVRYIVHRLGCMGRETAVASKTAFSKILALVVGEGEKKKLVAVTDRYTL
jgi:hypothetical protein